MIKRAHDVMISRRIDFKKAQEIKDKYKEMIEYIEEVALSRAESGRKNAIVPTGRLVDDYELDVDDAIEVIKYFEELDYLVRIYLIDTDTQVLEVCWA